MRTESPAPGPEATCRPPLARPSRPTHTLPADTCDSHCHVFGPGAVFPYAPDRPFTPPDAPKEALARLHDMLGVRRAVLVQSSTHGVDHSALLDALDSRPDDYRGVALLPPTVTASQVAALAEHGVCGVRFHLVSHLGAPAPLDAVRAVLGVVSAFGWHAAFHLSGADLVANHDFLARLDGPVVIDHMARIDLGEGLAGPAVDALARLLERGNVWVKLSGPERVSLAGAPYQDAVGLARLLARHAPDRVLWGTDYPHPNIPGEMVDDGELVDLLPQIVPDPGAARLLLVDNPAALFGFTGTAS